MNLGTSLLGFALHGAPEFLSGVLVTVKHACTGMHQVDIGMNSYSIDFPLAPGDLLIYVGPHLGEHDVVTISIKQARRYLARFDVPSRRTEAKSYLQLLKEGRAGPVRPVDLLLPRGALERRIDDRKLSLNTDPQLEEEASLRLLHSGQL